MSQFHHFCLATPLCSPHNKMCHPLSNLTTATGGEPTPWCAAQTEKKAGRSRGSWSTVPSSPSKPPRVRRVSLQSNPCGEKRGPFRQTRGPPTKTSSKTRLSNVFFPGSSKRHELWVPVQSGFGTTRGTSQNVWFPFGFGNQRVSQERDTSICRGVNMWFTYYVLGATCLGFRESWGRPKTPKTFVMRKGSPEQFCIILPGGCAFFEGTLYLLVLGRE